MMSTDAITKHYVERYWHGSFVHDTTVEEVAKRDAALVEDKNEFGFRFFDQTETMTGEGEKLTGSRKNLSPHFYRGGRRMSLEEVENELPRETILAQNMRGNKWDYVVRTRCGGFVDYAADDVFL